MSVSVPYLISALAVAVGLAVLLTVLVRLRSRAHRMAGTLRRSRADLAARIDMLSARIAALRVALSRRRHRDGDSARPATAA